MGTLLIENALTLAFANKQTLFHNFICEKPNREEEDQIDYMIQSPSTKFYEIDDILQKQKLNSDEYVTQLIKKQITKKLKRELNCDFSIDVDCALQQHIKININTIPNNKIYQKELARGKIFLKISGNELIFPRIEKAIITALKEPVKVDYKSIDDIEEIQVYLNEEKEEINE